MFCGIAFYDLCLGVYTLCPFPFLISSGLSLCYKEFSRLNFLCPNLLLNDTDLSRICVCLFGLYFFMSSTFKYKPVRIDSLLDYRLNFVCGFERFFICFFSILESFTLFILCYKNITALISWVIG
jgi:hypothetical protein